ncbi:MAG TPA: hypothetical protein VIL71_15190 [Spirillospora sp.]
MSDEAPHGPVPPAAQHAPAVGEVTAAEEAADAPDFPDVPPPEPTGDPRVDEALARLGELGALPVSEHVEIYEDVHRRLQDLLASADPADPADAARPAGAGGPPAPPRPAFPDALRPRP